MTPHLIAKFKVYNDEIKRAREEYRLHPFARGGYQPRKAKKVQR